MVDIAIKTEIERLMLERNFTAAKTLCLTVCNETPDDVEALILMGGICGQSGDFKAAEKALLSAFEIAPNDPLVNYNLGLALYYQNNFKESVEYLARAAQYDSQQFDVWFYLGMSCEGLGNKDNAIVSFEKAIVIKPDSAEILKRLGKLYIETERWPLAVEALERLFKQNSFDTDVISGLCMALCNAYQYERLISNVEPVAINRPQDYLSNYYVAQAYLEQAEIQHAEKYFERVLAVKSDHIESLVGLSSIKSMTGEYDQALELISPFLKTHSKSPAIALCFSLIGPHFNREDEAIRLLKLSLKDTSLPVIVRGKLAVTLGRLYERNGDYDRAFELFKKGNDIYSPDFDCDNYLKSIDIYKDVYGESKVDSVPLSSNDSKKPIFIVGIPRSGTSLVEQILASHPQVYGAGELKYIQNYSFELNELKINGVQYPFCMTNVPQAELDRLSEDYLQQLNRLSNGEDFVTDKMPLNYQNLGLIYQLFPNAKIINCVRDPIDTCLSCYSQFFSGAYLYAFDLWNLGFVYRAYEKLIRYWKNILPIEILDVHYEDLVNDQLSQTKRILEYCDLPWSDDCIDFYTTKRTVATASVDQVSKPLYNSSIEKWRRYEKHISRLIESLEENKNI